jgi:hypothetical protein
LGEAKASLPRAKMLNLMAMKGSSKLIIIHTTALFG